MKIRQGNCDIKVIGHRGTLTHAPENTMYAFHAAYEMGADWVETDVKVTANGTFVLVHDETVDRTTNGTGTVSELSLVYITGLDAGSRFDPSYRDARVPELAELLNWSKEHSGVCLHLPSTQEMRMEDAHRICQLVTENNLLEKTLVMSSDYLLVKELNKAFPRATTGLLYQKALTENFRRAARGDFDYLHPARFTVNKRIINQAHEAGVPVAAMVLPERNWILERWRWGVDIFNCDSPDMPRSVIEAELKKQKVTRQNGRPIP